MNDILIVDNKTVTKLDKKQIIPFNSTQVKQKMEYYCNYQDRCHDEINSKLFTYKLLESERNEIIVYLIENNFLNETRFACSFARGKHRMSSWGRNRIVNELKFRHISTFNIKKALQEFSDDEYLETFAKLADRCWNGIGERNATKKRKKFCDYMLRKGYESNLVFDKVKEFEQT